jgi:hypothetical protein
LDFLAVLTKLPLSKSELWLQESENYCAKGMTMTYNSSLDHGRIKTDSGYSYGGYSGSITVNRRFLVKVQKI